ncbi:MAG: glycosyl transferase, partial [Candidatus Angelobacter sp.]
RISLVLAVCALSYFFCVGPFLGVVLAPGLAKAGIAAAIIMIALAYTLSGRYMGNSALLFLTCPMAALVFDFAALQSAFLALRDGAITWRGTKYSLTELRKK